MQGQGMKSLCLKSFEKLYASKALKNTIDEAKIKSVRSVYK